MRVPFLCRWLGRDPLVPKKLEALLKETSALVEKVNQEAWRLERTPRGDGK